MREDLGKLFQQHENQLDRKTEEKICRNKRNSRRMTAVLASPARFERATFRLGGGRSILLSYGDIYQQLFYLIFEKESITLCGRGEIYLGDGAGY